MSRKKDIIDIDENEDGLVDYSGYSDDDNKSKDSLPENAFRRHPALDVGTAYGHDSTQPQQCFIIREDDITLVRSRNAFRAEMFLPVGIELPKAPTHLKVLELLRELFPEMEQGVHWDLMEGNFRNGLELSKILDDKTSLTFMI
jgi:hypothetical protein